MQNELNEVHSFLRKFFLGIGSAKARRLLSLLERAEWGLLQQETVDPRKYRYAQAYFKDALAVSVIKKLPLELTTSAEMRYRKAVQTFYDCEVMCRTTNQRLMRFVDNLGPFEDPGDLRVAEFITRWRKIIAKVLGKIPLRLDPEFTPGTTLSDPRYACAIPDKMSSRQTIYDGSQAVYRHSVQHTILDATLEPEIASANRFFTVPKSSDEERGCCVEASMMVVLQRACGVEIRKRYDRYFGVDSRNAKPVHMDRARKASIEAHEATIDLSKASDTLAHVLVRLVLPRDWYALLSSLRATHTEIDGKEVYLHKFSSMGNGFTFELETLVFRTMCEALGASSDECVVFGDDIIIPTRMAADVLAALRFFGFKPNEGKTFCEGPFRESCGGDYFEGQAVRPYFLKKIPDEPQDWVNIANGLRAVDPELRMFSAAWWYCWDRVPTVWRNRGPQRCGSGLFHDEDAMPRPPTDRVPYPHYVVQKCIHREVGLWRYPLQVAMTAGAVLQASSFVPRDAAYSYSRGTIPAYGVGVAEEVHYRRAELARKPVRVPGARSLGN